MKECARGWPNSCVKREMLPFLLVLPQQYLDYLPGKNNIFNHVVVNTSSATGDLSGLCKTSWL